MSRASCLKARDIFTIIFTSRMRAPNASATSSRKSSRLLSIDISPLSKNMFNTLKTSPYRIAALLILAFALRAGYGLRIKGNVWPPDAGSFDSIAWNLASEGRYVSADQMPTSYRPPSYVGFLAGIYKIAGHNYAAARAAQAFLGAALLLVIMSLPRRITAHPSAPWIAGGMAAVYPFFIYYDSKLIPDPFIGFWLVLSG